MADFVEQQARSLTDIRDGDTVRVTLIAPVQIRAGAPDFAALPLQRLVREAMDRGDLWIRRPRLRPPQRWTLARLVQDAAGSLWEQRTAGAWTPVAGGAAQSTADLGARGPLVPLLDGDGRPVSDADRDAAVREQ